jgi:tRNA (guanine-N7-)-methyltransferase
MWDVLDATPGLRNRAGARGHVSRPEWRPQTHFETRGQKLGHGVWDLLYDKDADGMTSHPTIDQTPRQTTD